jgi:hypothetical protein
MTNPKKVIHIQPTKLSTDISSGPNPAPEILFFYMFQILYLMSMELKYDIEKIEEGRVRVVITYLDEELGVLYFEKAKKGFTNKPISMDGWRCVDAKVERLYVYGKAEVTPKEMVATVQDLLKAGNY